MGILTLEMLKLMSNLLYVNFVYVLLVVAYLTYYTFSGLSNNPFDISLSSRLMRSLLITSSSVMINY